MEGAYTEAKKYPNEDYFKFIKNVISLRKDYTHSAQLNTRKEIAEAEYKAWMEYVDARKVVLQKEEKGWMGKKTREFLQECFDRNRVRDDTRIKATALIDAHHMFVQTQHFHVPIHPRGLSQMIHPHQGYMISYPEGMFEWEDLMRTYEI